VDKYSDDGKFMWDGVKWVPNPHIIESENSKLKSFTLRITPYIFCGAIYAFSILIFDSFFKSKISEDLDLMLLDGILRMLVIAFLFLSVPMLSLILGIFSGRNKLDNEQSNPLEKIPSAFMEGFVGTFLLLAIVFTSAILSSQFYEESISEELDTDLDGVLDINDRDLDGDGVDDPEDECVAEMTSPTAVDESGCTEEQIKEKNKSTIMEFLMLFILISTISGLSSVLGNVIGASKNMM
tara:strand:- start:745 stop:1461 length:717 start_codon:yes stop_codon:yes gene_type:complete